MKYKGYRGKANFDELINSFSGYVCNLKSDVISFEGSSVSELNQSFIDAIDGYLSDCEYFNEDPELPNDESEIQNPEQIKSWQILSHSISDEIKDHLQSQNMTYNDLGILLGRGRSHVCKLLSSKSNMTLKTYHDIWFSMGIAPFVQAIPCHTKPSLNIADSLLWAYQSVSSKTDNQNIYFQGRLFNLNDKPSDNTNNTNDINEMAA